MRRFLRRFLLIPSSNSGERSRGQGLLQPDQRPTESLSQLFGCTHAMAFPFQVLKSHSIFVCAKLCLRCQCPWQKQANNLQGIIEQLSANKADRRELLELKQFMVSLNVSWNPVSIQNQMVFCFFHSSRRKSRGTGASRSFVPRNSNLLRWTQYLVCEALFRPRLVAGLVLFRGVAVAGALSSSSDPPFYA